MHHGLRRDGHPGYTMLKEKVACGRLNPDLLFSTLFVLAVGDVHMCELLRGQTETFSA